MAKTNVVANAGVTREKGFLYFVDKQGDVSRAPMRNSGKKGGVQKVAKVGVKKKSGCMYFVDKSGNVCEVQMSRDGAKKKAKLAKPSVKFVVYSQKKGNRVVNRSKKILLAEKGRNYNLALPNKKNGVYGVVLNYEAKVSTQYAQTAKFIKLAAPAVNVRLVNKVPKKYD
ncbi:hypothetical protein KY311_04550 [Candidatus Woesearchaeota archaeon]|nr:hypothetical protein [Candidatus Woesearchaeota archaeon]MBW3016735.1 hypothetical protein [Candidatus Woesearchaeota archaeon]